MQHSTAELQTLSGTNISTKTAPGASWRRFSWLSSFCRGDVEGSSALVSLAGTTVFGEGLVGDWQWLPGRADPRALVRSE